MTSLAPLARSAPLPAATVELAAAGDEAAFGRVVSAYNGDMLRVAYVVAGERQAAEDAVQGAWLIAWRKLRTLHDPERVRPWLVAVAANEARQVVRRQRRRTVAEIRVRPLAAAGDDPPDAIDRVDLVNALNLLRPEDRTLIALRYVARLDSTEIGMLLKMSPSGVRGHLSRVLGRLRGELGDG